ncbi:hypothetical protein W02_36620 [Nitrospira sp. KM1]|uniref:hypothetical protein n=1 Tax=Nitrospira sp. KM1 TaxID=1936990 RepID=UPI0013A71B08|nr:hypothetical protein [Nitrospira sp. KM1]BCA56522.1 hypothetical protein W02_36620 [Nitrospira sp. KM1]
MFTRRAQFVVLTLATFISLPVVGHSADAPNGRIEISGDYRYASHEFEPKDRARDLACREAWRQAVINSPLYKDQTAAIVDSPILRDLAYSLAANQVQDGQIVEQTEKGRLITCRVKGYLPTEDSVRVIRTQLAGGPPPSDAIDQNRVLKIVAVREEGPNLLAIQYQALKRLDWLSTNYDGGLRESADIMVDFYDAQGFLIKTERFPARLTPNGSDVMNPGAEGVLKVTRPTIAKTYRVWLVK